MEPEQKEEIPGDNLQIELKPETEPDQESAYEKFRRESIKISKILKENMEPVVDNK